MKRVFQLIIVAMFSLMVATSASAWQAGHNVTGGGAANFPGIGGALVAENQMVSIAENGIGDLLIFPLYAAVGEFSSKITVVNTAENQSTVAKVVIREGNLSKEVLDFYIYLSPADMWTGYIYYDPSTGHVRVWSDDDSIQHPTGFAWATPQEPFHQSVLDNDDNWLGYVTVFNVATYDAVSDNRRANAAIAPGNIGRLGLQNRPADKQAIHDWFWGFNPSRNLFLGTRDGNVGKEGFQWLKNRNILTGWVDVKIGNNVPPFTSGSDASASMMATVFQDYNTLFRPLKREDMTIWGSSNDERLNWPVGVRGLPAGFATNLNEVEAVLAKSSAKMPYQFANGKQSIHFFNFPTKYSQDGPRDIWGNQWPESLIFQTHGRSSGQCIRYAPGIYDKQEQYLDFNVSPYPFDFCREVDLVDTFFLSELFAPFFFDEGWINYNFLNPGSQDFYRTLVTTPNFPNNVVWPFSGQVGTLLDVTGFPVIPYTLTLDGTSMRLSGAAHGDTYSVVYAAPGVGDPAAGESFAVVDNKLIVVDADGNDVDKGSAGPNDLESFTKN